MSIVAAGRNLASAAARLHESLLAAHEKCERTRRPRGGTEGGGGVERRRPRRVPSGEAGAALLGHILSFNPHVTGLPAWNSWKGPKG